MIPHVGEGERENILFCDTHVWRSQRGGSVLESSHNNVYHGWILALGTGFFQYG